MNATKVTPLVMTCGDYKTRATIFGGCLVLHAIVNDLPNENHVVVLSEQNIADLNAWIKPAIENP